MLRRQLPAYSPLTWRAVVAGVRAALIGDAAVAQEVVEQVRLTFQARDVLLTDSGTSALALALYGVSRAALPAYTCFDVATAADSAGCEVLAYDVDPRTLGPDPDSLRRALRDGAAAVVVAPLYGIPVDMAMVTEVAAAAEAIVIEDAAQAGGARLSGRPVGSFGSLSVLSFGRGKGITGGGGGALLAHDVNGRRMLESARAALGQTSRGVGRLPSLIGQWIFGRPSLYGFPAALPFLHLGETIYRRPSPPRPASAASLGVLSQTLSLASGETEVRRVAGDRYAAAAISGRDCSVPVSPRGGEPGYLRFPVVCSDAKWQDMWAARRLGVMAGYPLALPDLDGFATRVRNRDVELPGARMLARRLATLPTHSHISEKERQELESWLRAPPARR